MGADRGTQSWPEKNLMVMHHLDGGWFAVQMGTNLVIMDRKTLVKILKRRGGGNELGEGPLEGA